MWAPESLLEVPDDRPRRGDRQLLTRDLEDERPESVVEGRKLVRPCEWPEVGPFLDQLSEHWIRLAKELARFRIGERSLLAKVASACAAACESKTMTEIPRSAPRSTQ